MNSKGCSINSGSWLLLGSKFKKDFNGWNPAPVTEEIKNIGAILSLTNVVDISIASSLDLMNNGVLRQLEDFKILTNCFNVCSKTFGGAISILVIQIKTGTFKASDIAKCSLDIPIKPAFAPTIKAA